MTTINKSQLNVSPFSSAPKTHDRPTPTDKLHMPPGATFHHLLKFWYIYVNDFCRLVQGNRWTRRAVKRILLQLLDRVFCPLDKGDTEYWQEPASLKELRKGDAWWSTSKIILGWLIDMVEQKIKLPKHRAERLVKILDSMTPEMRWRAMKD